LTTAASEGRAFARLGLLGNPSDGYFGRALSCAIRNFHATVTLEEAADARPDTIPLLEAAITTFRTYCSEAGLSLPARHFIVRYVSTIPRQVGLAGSSAIVTAALRALMAFYEVKIPRESQPSLVLAAEVDQLGITAGLQDRVAQIYQGLVYMDLSQSLLDSLGHGAYEPLDPGLLPTLFVAHRGRSNRSSGQRLDSLKSRWQRGDPEVRHTLACIAALATRGREALLQADHAAFSSLMNENFDLRRRIMPIDGRDVAMVETARSLGASAKLAGSGGSVVGVYQGKEMRERLEERLGALDARVIYPAIA
jgi:glucuronokinase